MLVHPRNDGLRDRKIPADLCGAGLPDRKSSTHLCDAELYDCSKPVHLCTFRGNAKSEVAGE